MTVFLRRVPRGNKFEGRLYLVIAREIPFFLDLTLQCIQKGLGAARLMDKLLFLAG